MKGEGWGGEVGLPWGKTVEVILLKVYSHGF